MGEGAGIIQEGTAGHCQPTPYHFNLAHAPHSALAFSKSHQTELDAHLDTLTDKAECGEAWTNFSDDIVSEDFEKLSLEEQTKVRHRKESHVGTEDCKEGGQDGAGLCKTILCPSSVTLTKHVCTAF